MQRAAHVRAFFDTASERLHGVLARNMPDGTVITFALSGPGGGTWTVSRSGESVHVLDEEPALTDCRMACSVEVFDALIEGRLNAREAFMEGRLDVEGDLGLVQRLNKAFRRERRGS